MLKIREVEPDDVRSAVLRHDASFEAGQADAGCIQAALFFKKGTTPRSDRRKGLLKGRSCRQGGNIVLGGTCWLDLYFLASLQSLRFLRIDVCPIEKCLFNGRYARICAPGHGWQVSPGNAARGRDPDSKDPLAGKHGSGLDGSLVCCLSDHRTSVV